jgi:hypothetical protein
MNSQNGHRLPKQQHNTYISRETIVVNFRYLAVANMLKEHTNSASLWQNRILK